MKKRSPARASSRFPLPLAGCILLTVLSCAEMSPPPAFDAVRAFELLVRQTDLGPRNPGSVGWQRFHAMVQAHFDSLGIACLAQPFEYYDYMTNDTVHMVNWIARINPDKSERVLVAAHYDCRPRAEYDPDSSRRDEPIIGANDGASGTAVVLHLAELCAARPPRIGVDLVLFDGEDYGPPGRNGQYLLGSKHFAALAGSTYKYGLVIDMIGDRDLQIYREVFSERYAKEITDRVWRSAARLGIPQFIDSVKHDILDDHLPLIAAGIPAVSIIDFDYDFWHTHADTPDKCDSASLSAVGRVVVDIIYGE